MIPTILLAFAALAFAFAIHAARRAGYEGFLGFVEWAVVVAVLFALLGVWR